MKPRLWAFLGALWVLLGTPVPKVDAWLTPGSLKGFSGTNNVSLNNVINVKSAPYNAKGDARVLSGGAITSGSNILTVPGGTNALDLGRTAWVEGANAATVVAQSGTVALSTCVNNFGTVTCTTTGAAHDLAATQTITIAGTTNASFNTTWIVNSVPSSTSFTFLASAALANSTGGTVGSQITLRGLSNPAVVTMTAGTISFVPASGSTPAQINDSANGLVAAGFTVGDQVLVINSTGFLNDTIFEIISVAPGTLQVGALLKSQITSVQDATHLVLANNAVHTTTASKGWIGTDDSVAIRAALAAVPASGATVLFPCQSTYMASDLHPSSNTKMTSDCGENAAQTSQPKLVASASIRLVYIGPGISNFTLEGLDLYGNRAEYPPGPGPPSAGGYNVDCMIAVAHDPFGDGPIAHLLIDHSTFEQCQSMGWRVLGGNPSGTITGSNDTITDVTLTNSIVRETGAHAVLLQGWVSDFTAINNKFASWAESIAGGFPALTCCRFGQHFIATDNLFEGNGVTNGSQSHAISADGVADVTIGHNIITGTSGVGIEGGFVNNGNITSNSIHDSPYVGISLAGTGQTLTLTDISTASGSPTITSASAEFYPALRHRGACITGFGHTGTDNHACANILRVNSPTSITLDRNALSTLTNQTIRIPFTTSDVSIADNQITDSGTPLQGAIYGFVNPESIVNGITCTNGSKTITGPTGTFAQANVGETVQLNGCGTISSPLNFIFTIIEAVASDTSATIMDPATASSGAGAGQMLLYPFAYNMESDGTATMGSSTVTLGATDGSLFIPDSIGEPIVIDGAGPAGATYHGRITAIIDSSNASVSPLPSTSVAGTAIVAVATRYGYNYGNHIEGNIIHHSLGNGVQINGAQATTIANNKIYDSVQNGIFIYPFVNQIDVNHNFVKNNGTSSSSYVGVFANFFRLFGTVFQYSSNTVAGNFDGTGTNDELLLLDNAVVPQSAFVLLSDPLSPRAGGVGAMTGAPMWARYFGNGADGAGPASGSIGAGPAEHQFTSWSCTGAVTVPAANNSIIVRSQGPVTFGAGCVLNVSNISGGGAGNNTNGGDLGGAGGSGGSGAANSAASIASTGSTENITSGLVLANPSTRAYSLAAAASSAGAGNDGGVISTGATQMALSLGYPFAALGGGTGTAGGSSGGVGGRGGGVIIIIAPSITIASGATFVAAGAPGVAPTANSTGAGGGGGGGNIWFLSETFTDNGGVYKYGGGPGGAITQPSIQAIGGGCDTTGCGTDAVLTVTGLTTGGLDATKITITNGGSGFKVAPICLVNAGGSGLTGSPACHFTISAGAIASVVIDTPGSGGTLTTFTGSFIGGYGANGKYQQVLLQ